MFSHITLTPLVLLLVVGWSQSGPYYYRTPFTAFRPEQKFEVFRDSVPGVYSLRSSNAVLPPRVSYSPTDIIQQTRQQADSLKVVLRNLAQRPTSAKYIKRVLDSGSCINSLEEAIGAIEEGVKLVENAGPEIQGLVATVKSLENERDIEKLVKISANILRQLEVVIPKIAPSNPTICRTSPEATFEALRNIVQILDDVAEDESLYLSELNKNEVKRTAKVVYGVTTFIKQLRGSFSKFNLTCTPDKKYNLEAISAIGDMMENLADLFGVLGGFEDAKKIRENAEFTKKVKDAINQLVEFDLGKLDCNTPGSFKATADILEDVADLIDEVGLENLKQQLGLNLDF